MQYKHTGARIFELSSQQGRYPTITPDSAAPTQIVFNLISLPTQKDSKFWYYLEAAWLKIKASGTNSNTSFAGIVAENLWKILVSVEVQCPLLGTLFGAKNTRGSVLGLLIQRLGFGYNALPAANLTPVGGTASTFAIELWYRIPFAQDFLANRMETAPWVGLLEGGTVTVNIGASDVLNNSGQTNLEVTSVTTSLALTLLPDSEPRVHTPVIYREHNLPASQQLVIPDMGSPDGLQGVDQSRGCGIAHLSLLTGPANTGLSAGTTAANITSFEVPWRDQNTVYNPELAYIAQFQAQGIAKKAGGVQAALYDTDFPHIVGSAIPNGTVTFNNVNALIFPLVPTGNDVMTSKLQTVAGAKQINLQYTSDPSVNQRLLGCYFPVFDDQFADSLAARIYPSGKGVRKPKLINKQGGNIVPGVGKFAYVADKVE